ncbi:MAG: hypothetical protein ACXWVE_10955 [Rhodoplanes sp.]
MIGVGRGAGAPARFAAIDREEIAMRKILLVLSEWGYWAKS